MAQRLRRAVRSDDVVGRLGGDEFVALLIGQIACSDLDALADRLPATLSEPVVIDDVTLRVGASIGIVVIENNDPRGAAEILRDADTAMYAAKTTGRGNATTSPSNCETESDDAPPTNGTHSTALRGRGRLTSLKRGDGVNSESFLREGRPETNRHGRS